MYIIKRKEEWYEMMCFLKDEIYQWMEENCIGEFEMNEDTGDLSFDNLSDSIMFKLRW